MTSNFQLYPGASARWFDFQKRRISDERVVDRVIAGAHDLWPQREHAPGDEAMTSGWRTALTEAHGILDPVLRFAREVGSRGTTQAVLLGMGGSVQGARAFVRLLENQPCRAGGHPIPVTILDTVVPGDVLRMTRDLDLETTLFIVASKSGATVETNTLYRYFRRRVEEAVGQANAGERFAAVTAPGSPLAALAEDANFLRCFEAPENVGGRFSALTYFGLVPAAIAGVDVRAVVRRADEMGRACESGRLDQNPGAALGAWLASLMRDGRDKLTFISSPGARALQPWTESLVAESTGKGGAGLIPVVGEPPLNPDQYGEDRAFVHLGLEGENDAEADRLIRSLIEAGHPAARITMKDRLEVGAEMYRWQFATVTASTLAGVWPFDQPDVQASKDLARGIVSSPVRRPAQEAVHDRAVVSELTQAPAGSYLAVMAFTPAGSELEAALLELRRAVSETWGFPVTVGYGPAFLHTTGQSHKGGPASLVGLQLVSRGGPDISVPDETYSFGGLLAAQADGDLQALRDKGLAAFRLLCNRSDSETGSDPAGAVLRLCREIRKARPV